MKQLLEIKVKYTNSTILYNHCKNICIIDVNVPCKRNYVQLGQRNVINWHKCKM